MHFISSFQGTCYKTLQDILHYNISYYIILYCIIYQTMQDICILHCIYFFSVAIGFQLQLDLRKKTFNTFSSFAPHVYKLKLPTHRRLIFGNSCYSIQQL